MDRRQIAQAAKDGPAATQSTPEFLRWLRDRFVFVYKESPNMGYLHRLLEIADKLEEFEEYLGIGE